MHLNYYFLEHLAAELRTKLVGRALTECYTQNKRELTILFDESFHMVAHLLPGSIALRFPNTVGRAKRNTTNLFSDLEGLTVSDVWALKYDRTLCIELGEFLLIFRLYKAGGNVLLVKNGVVVEIFLNTDTEGGSLDVFNWGRPFPGKKEFIESEGDLSVVFPVIGKELGAILFDRGYGTATIEQKWELFTSIIREVGKATQLFILETEDLYFISFFPEGGNIVWQGSSAIEATEKYFQLSISRSAFKKAKDTLIRQLVARIDKLRSWIASTESKWIDLEGEDPHRYLADVIMSQIHQIGNPTGVIKVIGFEGEELEVNLGSKSASKYAENLYRKSRNRKIEVRKTEESLKARTNELNESILLLEKIREAASLKEIKPFIKEEEKEKATLPVYYHEIVVDGFFIRIGKNGKSNDRLTFENGTKDDLWLHVKDAPGSHVLIKNIPGRKVPSNVIDAAAREAAWFSKRKTEGLVPVIVTFRKYVRKRKGDPPGAVVVEKEEVILAEPISLLRQES